MNSDHQTRIEKLKAIADDPDFQRYATVCFNDSEDGRCIALDRSETSGKLITDNYELLRKLAESIEYQYILNMNYTRFTFSDKRRN